MGSDMVAHELMRAASAIVPTQYRSTMEFSLSEIGQVLGMMLKSEAPVTGWTTDTRTIAPGDLFFALHGPNFDGNAFVEEALGKGGSAAIADSNPKNDLRILTVPDTLEALQQHAHWARNKCG